VLGEISDRVMPLALQRRAKVYGLSKAAIAQWKTPYVHSVVSRGLLVCGHVDSGETICKQCMQIMQRIGEVVFDSLRLNNCEE
jgi:hypothetical protein